MGMNYIAFIKAIDPEQVYLNRVSRASCLENLAEARAGGFKASRVADAQPGRAPLICEFPRLNTTKENAGTIEPLLYFLRQKVS